MAKATFPTSFRPIALRVCQHEAGHYVVARSLGFRTGGLSIKFIDFCGGYRAGSDVTLPTSLSNISEVTDYLKRRVKVLYAGALAEAMIEGVIDGEKALEYIRNGGADDYSKVRELVHIIRSIEHGLTGTDDEAQAQLDAIDRALWNAAANIVMEERAVIEGLANRLESEVKAVGEFYEISQAELAALPALIQRFGDG